MACSITHLSDNVFRVTEEEDKLAESKLHVSVSPPAASGQDFTWHVLITGFNHTWTSSMTHNGSLVVLVCQCCVVTQFSKLQHVRICEYRFSKFSDSMFQDPLVKTLMIHSRTCSLKCLLRIRSISEI